MLLRCTWKLPPLLLNRPLFFFCLIEIFTQIHTIFVSSNICVDRIEYDAYRADMESLQLGPKDASTQAKLHEARVKYEKQKERFDKLRQDVAVKLKFLEENKVRT